VGIPRQVHWIRRCLAEPAAYDVVIAAFAGAGAVYVAWVKGDWITGFLAAVICLVSIRKAWVSIFKNFSQKSIHELEGCLNTLHAIIHKEGISVWMTLHLPINAGQQLEQIMDYVSDDASYISGAGRKHPSQCGVIGVALREKEPILAVRENSDYQAYIRELIKEWSYTESDARELNPATMSSYAVPLKNQDEKVECVLYCASTDRDLFQPEVLTLINNACIGIARFIRYRYSS
jgi:hypothetical protein